MREKPARTEGNALLRTLSRAQHDRFLAEAERVDFAVGRVIADSEQSIEFVYFPLTAVLSVLSVMTDRSAIETAVVGHEGMAPIAAFHRVDSAAEQVMVQYPGTLLRMPTGAFLKIVDELPTLALALHRFSQALFTFASKSSGCNRKHSVVQRCARWLLIMHDRVPGDELMLTHLFLAQMLGVRRSSVTVAAESLRAAGAISYRRGKIRMIDRGLLRQQSCDCYDIVRSTYDRLVEGVESRSPLSDVEMSSGGMSLAHAGADGRRETPAPDAAEAAISEGALSALSVQLRSVQERSQELRRWIDDGKDAVNGGAATAATALRDALVQLARAEGALRPNGKARKPTSAGKRK